MGTLKALCVLSLTLVCAGCDQSPQSGYGFRLPDGDIAEGSRVYQELGCPGCHDVAGDPPAAAGDEIKKLREPLVTLGGVVSRVETYGELVTSVINPSHEISPRYPKNLVADGDVSKMTNFNSQMTVEQLIDLTAFLQSKYEARPQSLYFP